MIAEAQGCCQIKHPSAPLSIRPFRFLSAPHFVDDRMRAPPTVSAIPPAISTTLMIGDTRSLWVVSTPMFTSPALIPCFSVWGIGTSRDAIPSTTKIRPANKHDFHKWLRRHLQHTTRTSVRATLNLFRCSCFIFRVRRYPVRPRCPVVLRLGVPVLAF